MNRLRLGFAPLSWLRNAGMDVAGKYPVCAAWQSAMPQDCGNRRMSLPLWRIVLKRLLKTVVALALVPTSFSCFADDALIRKAVNAMFNTQNAGAKSQNCPTATCMKSS